MAALEEVEGSKVCMSAPKQVEKEFNGGRPHVQEMDAEAVDAPAQPVMELSGDEPGPGRRTDRKVFCAG